MHVSWLVPVGSLTLMVVMWMLAAHLRHLVLLVAPAQNQRSADVRSNLNEAKAQFEKKHPQRDPHADVQAAERRLDEVTKDYERFPRKDNPPAEELKATWQFPWMMVFPGRREHVWAIVSTIGLPTSYIVSCVAVALHHRVSKWGAISELWLMAVAVLCIPVLWVLGSEVCKAVRALRQVLDDQTWIPKRAPFNPFPMQKDLAASS
jgi:hypothetical protein